jgi:hypothetical protein
MIVALVVGKFCVEKWSEPLKMLENRCGKFCGEKMKFST